MVEDRSRGSARLSGLTLLANITCTTSSTCGQALRKHHAMGDMIVVRTRMMLCGIRTSSRCGAVSPGMEGPAAEVRVRTTPDKTRLIEFGRHAAENRKRRGEGKPESSTFLGLPYQRKDAQDWSVIVKRKTIQKRSRQAR